MGRQEENSCSSGTHLNSSAIMRNMEFFLTKRSEMVDPNPRVDPPKVEQQPYDYDTNFLREKIEACGGIIIHHVGEEKGEKVYLISNGYSRSTKYLYALAKGIPCVSHEWIMQCLEMNEIVYWNPYTLPAGWSVERKTIMYAHRKRPLNDFNILFCTSADDILLKFWTQLLNASGVKLPESCNSKKANCIPKETEVLIIGEQSRETKTLIANAHSKNIPVLNTEWLVESVIAGERSRMYTLENFKVMEDADDKLENNNAKKTVMVSVKKSPSSNE